ncbi:MAG: hypothetical protein V3V31_06595 [Methylococcales bacterium]
MSFEEKYTEEEQFLLTSTPSLIGSAMAFAEGSGLGTIKEMIANAKTMMGGVKSYPDNDIIKGVLPNLEDRKEAMAKAKEFRAKTMARLEEKGIKSHEMMRDQLIEDCQAVSELLKNKASPQEASEYKNWAMSVAQNVAMAAKEGGFLGIGGERISEGEKVMFDQVAQALGVDSQLV